MRENLKEYCFSLSSFFFDKSIAEIKLEILLSPKPIASLSSSSSEKELCASIKIAFFENFSRSVNPTAGTISSVTLWAKVEIKKYLFPIFWASNLTPLNSRFMNFVHLEELPENFLPFNKSEIIFERDLPRKTGLREWSTYVCKKTAFENFFFNLLTRALGNFPPMLSTGPGWSHGIASKYLFFLVSNLIA